MKIVKSSFILAALALSTTANARLLAPDWLDNVFVTVNPVKTNLLQGPVLDVQSSDYNTYADRVIQIAMQESHRHAKKYLQTKEYKKYYSMMLMGLTVPMHEGLFTHFRRVSNTNDRCNTGRNAGDTLKDQRITRTNFRSAFHSEQNPADSYLADCNKLSANQPIIQMVAGGGDGSDIGIMQLSARWHYEDFLALDKFKSVRSTLNYGNQFLARGFNAISRNAETHVCILNNDKSINHLKLARASWGGWYNAGGTNYERVCRFSFKEGSKNFRLTDANDKFYQAKYKNPQTGKTYELGDTVTIGGKLLKQCLDPNKGNQAKTTVRNTVDGCAHAGKDAGFNVNLSNMIKVARENKDFGIVLGRKDENTLYGFWPSISTSSRNAIKDIVRNLYNGTNSRAELDKLLQ